MIVAEKEVGTKKEAEEVLRRQTSIYFSSGGLVQHRMRYTPLGSTHCPREEQRWSMDRMAHLMLDVSSKQHF